MFIQSLFPTFQRRKCIHTTLNNFRMQEALSVKEGESRNVHMGLLPNLKLSIIIGISTVSVSFQCRKHIHRTFGQRLYMNYGHQRF